MANESTVAMHLTQERVLKTSSVDKGSSIKTFVNAQARYLSDYAAEGKKALADWVGDIATKSDAKQTTESKNEKLKPPVGFSSPILKPRVPVKVDGRREERHERSNKENLANEKTKKERATTVRKPVESRKKESGSGARKRKAIPSDDEHAKRLDERKERRRVKREIVNPKEVHETDEESDNKPKQSDKRKARTSKRVNKDEDHQLGKGNKKLPAGLALMHGFNATNVGKQRLTVGNIASNSGVFSKGKASKKSKVEDRKTNSAKPTFDEAKFLGGFLPAPTRRSDKQRAKPSTVISISDDKSSTSIESEVPSTPKKYHITNKMSATKKHTKLVAEEPERSSSSSVVKSNYESEVWDIEREFENSTVSHDKLSKAPSASVVVNCKSLSWGAKVDQDTVIDEPTEARRDSRSPTSLSDRNSSLAPSQSASQLPIRVAAMNSGMISRFFGHDLKGNSDAGRLEQRKGEQASQLQPAPPRSPTLLDHAIAQDNEISQGTTGQDVEQDPTLLVTSFPADVEGEALEALNHCHESVDDEKAIYEDPLDLLDELNNGRLFAYNPLPSIPLDDSLSDMGFREDEGMWMRWSIPQPETEYPSDFLGTVEDDPITQYQPESLSPEGDFHESLDDAWGRGIEDPSFVQNFIVSEEDDASMNPYDVLDTSRGSRNDAWSDEQRLEEGYEHETMEEDAMEEDYLFHDDGATAVYEDHIDSDILVSDSIDASETFFSQGRALLLGVDYGPKEQEDSRETKKSTLGDIEMSVAKNLRGHWHPVKF
ncbi:hypothetical protein SCHPADRAFT_995152 [Schizopora paradoxa]|uniref:Uncharacterized protein n=1 Tax=Schizopora paradoxa TaxID=27342 RepID=A0A0H2RWV1_9AGAM|nr:hypothetical protein SCHPADRAFT_995152 [Schizopora paradoxa]